jgi:hypothetical protein
LKLYSQFDELHITAVEPELLSKYPVKHVLHGLVIEQVAQLVRGKQGSAVLLYILKPLMYPLAFFLLSDIHKENLYQEMLLGLIGGLS